MKRGDEEFCRSEFDKFLSRFTDQIQWEGVEQANEPPNYYLELNHRRFAVEVTSLHEVVDIAPNPLTATGFVAASKRFVEMIEQVAHNQGILHGAYVITIKPLNNFAQIKELIMERILDYLRATKSLSSAREQIVFEQNHHTFSIQKMHDGTNYVTFGIPLDAKWEGESIKELQESLESVLAEKKGKLIRLGEPKILLLLDSYHYLPSSEWKDCLSGISILSDFHTVFLASTEGSNLLYSENKNWVI